MSSEESRNKVGCAFGERIEKKFTSRKTNRFVQIMMNGFSARLGVKSRCLITLFARSRHKKKIIGDLPFLDGSGGGVDG